VQLTVACQSISTDLPTRVLFCVSHAALVAQVDALGRQLARGAADGEEASAHRENLLAELASAQQVGAYNMLVWNGRVVILLSGTCATALAAWGSRAILLFFCFA
jgi:hypothetical protein